MKPIGIPDEPWSRPWPAEDLETLGGCPVCGEAVRRILHADLVDNVFRVAPGKWTLYQCQACQSAYLDPRPTMESIGLAYQSYYTHYADRMRDELKDASACRRLRGALANGYTNTRYGTNYSPSIQFGNILAKFFPSKQEVLDAQFRWLPKPEAGQRLLDIGCGNGAFMTKARDSGWEVVGIDPDDNAVIIAKQLGLEAHVGSIDIFSEQIELVDAITISHVIEHLHEPESVLTAGYRLLKNGGTLFLETPNIQSRGFLFFGKNWRGIEAPRHLVLFSISGMLQLLKRCGFKNVEFKQRRSVTPEMFMKSFKLSLGCSPYGLSPKRLPFRLMMQAHLSKTPVSQVEFITLTARK